MEPEAAPGAHPVVRGAHLVALFAGEGADAAAATLTPAIQRARSVDELAPLLDGVAGSVDFAVLHVVGSLVRAALAGRRLAVRVHRRDGVVALFGGPHAAWSLVTETECVAAEVLDVAAARDDAALRPLAAGSARVSRILFRPATVPEASPAFLRFADGGTVDVDGALVLGRSPRLERVGGPALPRVVALRSAGPAVSRAHVRIDVEGKELTLEDLGSRNGTAVIEPTGRARRLAAGERVALLDGMVVTIADDLAFRVVAS